MEDDASEKLLLFWRDGLRLRLLDDYPTDGIVVEGLALRPHQPGQNLCLYDWIKHPNGRVVGLRLAVPTTLAQVAQWLPGKPGVQPRTLRLFDIVFVSSLDKGHYSDEEQYVADDVLSGDDGSFGFVVPLLGLEDAEIRDLKNVFSA